MSRLVFLVACSVLAIPASQVRSAERPPNIIHIVADDVGYDDIGPFGCKDIPTPNLDRLARQGRKFTNFYAPSPVCTPTRAALMTGCYAPRVGLPDVLFPFSKKGLAASEVTVAELLKSKGYATGLIGKWHLGFQQKFLPTQHGFDRFYGIPYPNDHEPVRVIWEKQGGKVDWRPPPLPLFDQTEILEQPADLERCPHRFVVEAVKFIKSHRDRPFFLHLSNIETHTPYFVASRFQGITEGDAFCDAVASLDWMVGEIEGLLIQLGLEENTLIVFTSDNGPLLENHADLPKVYGKYGITNTAREHRLRGAKGSVWEGGVRVACLRRWPGKIPAGTECHEICAGFDLFTTFAKLGGADIPADRIIDGKDITPLMTGGPDAKSPHEAFYYYARNRLGAVRVGPWKLVFTGKGKNAQGVAGQGPELFNLDEDISEKTDVSDQHPDIVDRLRKIADRAREDLGDASRQMPGKNRRPADEAATLNE